MEVKDFLKEDEINNIYNQYSNVFVIHYDENAKTGNNYVGELLLKVNITKDKSYIKVNDFVEFRRDKVKWKKDGIAVIDPYWVKLYLDKEKLPIKVKVLRSKVVDGKREYFYDYEFVEFTYTQFINRRLLEEYGNFKYSIMEAYSNFQGRRTTVGYYKALNETCKHYLIEHDHMKEVLIPRINNSLKRYKKEWIELYTQSLKQNKAREAISELVEYNKEKSADIIPLRKVNNN